MSPAAVSGPMCAQITRCVDAEAAATKAAQLVREALEAGIVEKGWGVLAVSGGRSLARTFERLAEADLDWTRIWIALVDEPWVEPEHPESNERLVRAHLLQGPARRAIFLPMKSKAVSPLASTGRQVRAFSILPKPLDAVVLDMGEDGRFASLFPGSRALRVGLDLDAECSCVAVPGNERGSAPLQGWMSFTLSAIAKSRSVLLLVDGKAKKRLLDRALAAICNASELPVAALLAARPDMSIVHHDA